MLATSMNLNELRTRALEGDAAAATRLRVELEPALQRIVRRALRTDAAPTPLARHLQSRARLAEVNPRHEDQAGLAAEVAASLAGTAERRLLGGVSARQPLRETIRDRA